jgi:pyruvate formate lyase activating enzyme
MNRGIVLDIERFAIHDGPGIRTVLFLKGCPLKCLWCSTVDSQHAWPEMEYFIDKCTVCGKCVDICPNNAIYKVDDVRIITDRQRCNNCGKCIEICSTGARKMAGKDMTVDQVMKEIEKDSLFFSNSGGGITLSGGEPTMQPDFSIEILKACKKYGINTAIETCGHTNWEILHKILKYTDFVYMDIKHSSSEKHKMLTLKRNALILHNIRKAASKFPDKPLTIRIPIIPGYNDSEKNISETAKFVCRLDGQHKIELLPYHKLGIHKYAALSRDYSLSHLKPVRESRMQTLESLIKSYGLEVQIGG